MNVDLTLGPVILEGSPRGIFLLLLGILTLLCRGLFLEFEILSYLKGFYKIYQGGVIFFSLFTQKSEFCKLTQRGLFV